MRRRRERGRLIFQRGFSAMAFRSASLSPGTPATAPASSSAAQGLLVEMVDVRKSEPGSFGQLTVCGRTNMNGLIAPRELRWLFLALNGYFASVGQNEAPELRGKPIAVLPLMTDATCVIAASYEARQFGVETGTPVWEAKRRCPRIKLVAGRHDLYVDYHHRILEEVDRHIPVTEVCSIDEVACRLDTREKNLAVATDLSRRIKEGLRRNIGPVI